MPQYPCKQHKDRVKSTGMQKHLNYLLSDYSEANRLLYGDTMPTSGRFYVPISPQEGSIDLSKVNLEERKSGRNAAAVNNRRTPSGQFFQSTNPSLFEKKDSPALFKGKYVTGEALKSVYWDKSEDSAVSSPQATGVGFGIATGTQFSATGTGGASLRIEQPSYVDEVPELKRNEAKWLLPWQTGDRNSGKLMAASIRNRRTPTGSFANLILAKK